MKLKSIDKNGNEEVIKDLYFFEEEGMHDFDGQGHFAKYHILQSVELFDKNGNELYHKDKIVLFDMKEDIFTIEWYHGAFGYFSNKMFIPFAANNYFTFKEINDNICVLEIEKV